MSMYLYIYIYINMAGFVLQVIREWAKLSARNWFTYISLIFFWNPYRGPLNPYPRSIPPNDGSCVFYWNPYPHTDKSIPLIHTPCIPSRNTRIKMPSRISGHDLAWSQPLLPSWLSLQFEFPYSALVSIALVNFLDICRLMLIKIDFVINTYFDHNE